MINPICLKSPGKDHIGTKKKNQGINTIRARETLIHVHRKQKRGRLPEIGSETKTGVTKLPNGVGHGNCPSYMMEPSQVCIFFGGVSSIKLKWHNLTKTIEKGTRRERNKGKMDKLLVAKLHVLCWILMGRVRLRGISGI